MFDEIIVQSPAVYLRASSSNSCTYCRVDVIIKFGNRVVTLPTWRNTAKNQRDNSSNSTRYATYGGIIVKRFSFDEARAVGRRGFWINYELEIVGEHWVALRWSAKTGRYAGWSVLNSIMANDHTALRTANVSRPSVLPACLPACPIPFVFAEV